MKFTEEQRRNIMDTVGDAADRYMESVGQINGEERSAEETLEVSRAFIAAAAWIAVKLGHRDVAMDIADGLRRDLDAALKEKGLA